MTRLKRAREGKSLYSVRIDLSNFFLSIRSRDLLLALSKSRELLPEWALGGDFCAVVRHACFDRAEEIAMLRERPNLNPI
jgi:hypothetical protein